MKANPAILLVIWFIGMVIMIWLFKPDPYLQLRSSDGIHWKDVKQNRCFYGTADLLTEVPCESN